MRSENATDSMQVSFHELDRGFGEQCCLLTLYIENTIIHPTPEMCLQKGPKQHFRPHSFFDKGCSKICKGWKTSQTIIHDCLFPGRGSKHMKMSQSESPELKITIVKYSILK